MKRSANLGVLLASAILLFGDRASGQPSWSPPTRTRTPSRGVLLREAGAFPGYTLIAPLRSTTIHLIDLDGRDVHRWATSYESGTAVLLDNGDLLRCCVEPERTRFTAGGACGRLQEIAWDGRVVWDFRFADDTHRQHHDLRPLPNGHVLFIAWEGRTREEVREAGRHPRGIGHDGFWSDAIFEVAPSGPDDARIVWEWHALDHVIQDFDRDSDNFGDVAAHPERIDLNADLDRPPLDAEERERIRALGYAEPADMPASPRSDWLHLNALDWDPVHDQIVVSSRYLDEVWIIDHSTTTEEARGHVGGRRGRGGDLLWRWGNPRNYRAGDDAARRFSGQHDARFIPAGLPGGGHLMVFNNGWRRPIGSPSEIVELALPRQELGGSSGFDFEPGHAYGPDAPSWQFDGSRALRFRAPIGSGAQRLGNGNTLVCDGPRGRVFEVDPSGSMVWDYFVPDTDARPEGLAPTLALFRAERLAVDHPGLRGRDLAPLPK